MYDLEKYFLKFRNNIIGINQEFNSPFGKQKIIYADWVASGRFYAPIEKKLMNDFAPFVANTHTETTTTSSIMTAAYENARKIIKKHVNANENDVLLFAGFGMTSAINKFHRILGIRFPEQIRDRVVFSKNEKPLVILTHMEHHSNQTSWLETIADVRVLNPDKNGLINLNNLEEVLKQFVNRQVKIGSFTAASNVTGIELPIHKMAKIMHKYGGFCFVDYAMSAPYVKIDMHPDNEDEKLDAIFFSPHKFLGGPASSGVILFDKKFYSRQIPDHPGGGTVDWTNPWGERKYTDDIEKREDGGTPGFIQAIRASLAIKLKEEMGIENIRNREEELLEIAFKRIKKIPQIHILAQNSIKRLGVISFYVEGFHFNLFVKILNDKFGIQTRGGCSCAGTYGHYLLNIDPTRSHEITNEINQGNLLHKPGWVRLSLHPTMTNSELNYILDSMEEIIKNRTGLTEKYVYNTHTNEFVHKSFLDETNLIIENLFNISKN